MRALILIWLLFPFLVIAQTPEALRAFQPQKWISDLKSEPRDDAPNLRKLQPEDQIHVLRSQGLWYEVDLVTNSGLEFRGWIKGDLPQELMPGENKVSITNVMKEEESPLKSKRFRWFWDRAWDERAYFNFQPGVQILKHNITGVDPSDKDVVIPGYNFTGLHLETATAFYLMKTQIKRLPIKWSLELDYAFGFFQVRFASNFNPIDVAGDAYRIQTHRLQLDSWIETKFNIKSSFSLEPGISLGYFFFEDAPDLKRTTNGDLIFTQIGMSALSLGIRNRFGWKDKVFITPRWNFFFLSDFKEYPNLYVGPRSSENSVAKNGSPLFFQILGEYRWTKSWSTILDLSYLQLFAKHKGPSRRIDVIYTDVEMELRQLKASLGLQFRY